MSKEQDKQTAESWWSDAGTRLAQALIVALVLGAGAWMTEVHGQLILMGERQGRLLSLAAELENHERRLQHLEDTRFSPKEREKVLTRVNALEARVGYLEAVEDGR